MKAKREEFWSMLEYTEPDITIASETWLNPEIKESEGSALDRVIYRC
jgi:hypothetical protein